MKILSAFSEINETKNYPHARTLRTSLYGKIKDTFLVLNGNLATDNHIGIFDYLTLGIPALIFGLLFLCITDKLSGNNHIAANTFLVPLIIINTPLILARIAFAIIITIAFSPMIALIHCIARLESDKDHTQALAVSGIKKTTHGTVSLTLGQCLKDNNMDAEDLKISVQSFTSPKSSKLKYQLKFYKLVEEAEPVDLLTVNLKQNSKGVLLPQPQAANIHSLFALNMGKATTNLEKDIKINAALKSSILSI